MFGVTFYQNGHLYKQMLQIADNTLFIVFPEAFTPVCESELGALEQWLPEFKKLGFDVIGITGDTPERVAEWFTTDEQLRKATYPVLCSRDAAISLGAYDFDTKRAKRSSIFMVKDEIVRVESFNKVGRSLAELHRMAYAYSSDKYCGEGWQNPEDGFLTKRGEK